MNTIFEVNSPQDINYIDRTVNIRMPYAIHWNKRPDFLPTFPVGSGEDNKALEKTVSSCDIPVKASAM